MLNGERYYAEIKGICTAKDVELVNAKLREGWEPLAVKEESFLDLQGKTSERIIFVLGRREHVQSPCKYPPRA